MGWTAMGTRKYAPPTKYMSPTVRNSPVADIPLIMIMPKARGRRVPRSPTEPAHSILLKLIFMSILYFVTY